MIRTGGCRCGGVRFEASGDPVNVRVCHCRLCQKSTGQPFFARALYPSDHLSIEGDFARNASSDASERGFCPNCGTVLFALRRDVPMAGVALAAFDDPNDLRPSAHIFAESMAPWLMLDDGLPRYPRSAP